MEIKNLDELQKLAVVENNINDVDLCSFTCIVTCKVTGVTPEALCAEERAQ